MADIRSFLHRWKLFLVDFIGISVLVAFLATTVCNRNDTDKTDEIGNQESVLGLNNPIHPSTSYPTPLQVPTSTRTPLPILTSTPTPAAPPIVIPVTTPTPRLAHSSPYTSTPTSVTKPTRTPTRTPTPTPKPVRPRTRTPTRTPTPTITPIPTTIVLSTSTAVPTATISLKPPFSSTPILTPNGPPYWINDSRETVIFSQGTPDKIDDVKRILHYGSSKLYFSTQWLLKEWNNSDGNLNLTPQIESGNSFWLGSTKSEVLKSQGAPVRINGLVWYYELSTIEFDSVTGDLVYKWVDPYNTLSLLQHQPDGSTFSIGSDIDRVLKAQGNPSQIVYQSNGRFWYFGLSNVRFNSLWEVEGISDIDNILNYSLNKSTPTPTPTPVPSITPTPKPTATPTFTPTPVADLIGPQITIVYDYSDQGVEEAYTPRNGSVIERQTVLFRVYAYDSRSGVRSVTFPFGGTNFTMRLSTDFSDDIYKNNLHGWSPDMDEHLKPVMATFGLLLDEGQYSYSFVATDREGNQSSIGAYSFTVDYP